MFNFISKKIRSLIIDDDFIRNLILKTVKENLKTNWDIQFVYQFDDRNLVLLMEADEKIRDNIGAINNPYFGDERLEKGFEGYIQFNLTVIKNHIANLGYFDSINHIKIPTLREIRNCQQNDFLREVGGDELIRRVNNELYDYPPDESILEVDIDAFALYGINLDFNDIFARYLKNDCESGDKHERFLQNSWCQSKFI